MCVAHAEMMNDSKQDDLTENEMIFGHLEMVPDMTVYQAVRLTVNIILETMQVALICSSDKIAKACQFLLTKQTSLK